MWTRIEVYQIPGQDSQCSLCWRETSKGIYVVWERDWRKCMQLPDLRKCGLKFWPKLETPLPEERKARVRNREVKTRSCSKIERLITSTGYEPNLLTFNELYDSSVPFSLMIPSADQDVDDLTLGEMLTQAYRGQVDYCVPGGMSVSQSSSSVMFDGSGQPDGERMVDRSGKPGERNSSNAQIMTLLEEQKQTIIAEYREKVSHHELQAAHSEEERRLLQGQLWRQKLESSSTKSYRNDRITEIPEFYLRYYCETKTHRGSDHYFGTIKQSTGMAKWSKLYERFSGFSGCWISLQWKFPRYQSTSVIPTSPDTWTDVEAFFRIAAPQRRAAKHLGHTWYIGKRFCKSTCIFISTLSPRIASMEFMERRAAPFIHSGKEWKANTESRSEMPVRTVSQKYSHLQWRNSPKNNGADQQRLQISDPHFDKFPTPATFACWKIRFKTEVCTCSQFPTEAMLWIKEVEMVDSVDDLKSSRSIRGTPGPNFELLDARIASTLNKIIHNSQFKRRISLEEQEAQKQDRFLRGRQIAYLIYEYFRVTGANDSVENYADLFTISLRNDDIQEFDLKWDGILLSMTKIPHDDILEGLYKLKIRESEKLKTVALGCASKPDGESWEEPEEHKRLELYDLEIHQKKLGPDYHRSKTMVKRSIEQEIRNKNFRSRNGNYEKNAVVKNQGTKQRVQKILGEWWQWETNGHCVKGDNCSFRHDIDKRGKSSPSNPSPNSFMRQNERKSSRTRSPRGKSPSGRMSRWRCKD